MRRREQAAATTNFPSLLTRSSPPAFAMCSIYLKRLLNPTRKADDGWKTGQRSQPFCVLLCVWKTVLNAGWGGVLLLLVGKRGLRTPHRCPLRLQCATTGGCWSSSRRTWCSGA